jgi:hypothetical protein
MNSEGRKSALFEHLDWGPRIGGTAWKYIATAKMCGMERWLEAFTMVGGKAFLVGSPLILSDRTGWRYRAAWHAGDGLMNKYDPAEVADACWEMEDPERRATYQKDASRLAAYLQSEELAERTGRLDGRVAEG